MNSETPQPAPNPVPDEPTPFAMRLPPPILFILIYVLGLAIRREVPLDIVPGSLASAASIVGGFLVVAGLLMAFSSLAMFLHRGTTLKPHGHPMHLVDYGPFMISRNPMYLSLMSIYTGAAIWQTALWPLILLPIPFLIINAIVIPYEERRMKALFGASYEDYAKRVRRWI